MSYNNKMEIAVLCIPGASQTLEDSFYVDGRTREWLDSSIVNIVTEDVIHDGIYAISTNGESYLNENRISITNELKKAQESFVGTGGDINSRTKLIKEQIGQINSILYTASLNNAEIKEPAMSCICIENNHYTLLTCGESKTFIYQNGIARQITNSTSKINRLVSLGIMTEDQAKEVNMGDETEGIVQYPVASLSSKDIIVMTSGAACEYIDDEYVSVLLNSNMSISSVCTKLLQKAVEAGVESDLSVMIIKVGESEVIDDAFLEEFDDENNKISGVVAAILAAILMFVVGLAIGFMVLPSLFNSQPTVAPPAPEKEITESYEPQIEETEEPVAETEEPSQKPKKTKKPTEEPVAETEEPTNEPTREPTKKPTKEPTQEPTQAPEVTEDTYYTVKSGDSLTAISKKFYGVESKYKLIMEANDISDARTLKIGQRLLIPKSE